MINQQIRLAAAVTGVTAGSLTGPMDPKIVRAGFGRGLDDQAAA